MLTLTPWRLKVQIYPRGECRGLTQPLIFGEVIKGITPIRGEGAKVEPRKTRYWMCVRTLENFEIDRGRGFRVIGFRHKNEAQARRLSVGDKIVYYLVGQYKFSAIAEVVSGYYHSEEHIWTESNEPWPARVGVRPIVVLSQAQFLDIRDLLPTLGFVKKKESWGIYLHHSIREIPESDFRIIEAKMLGKPS